MYSHQLSNLNSETSDKVSWLWAVIILYCLSGFTSLAYEVLWSRMLSMQFGVSIFGVVFTVAAFMFGLGIGSLAGARRVNQCDYPLVMFAILELSISFYALVLPTLLQSINGWIEDISGRLSLAQWYLLQAVEGTCLLGIPAIAMGISFALVLKVVHHSTLSLGKLYGLNTIGGAVGALFPLWSLAVLGWTNSVRVIAMIGLAVGCSALVLSRFKRTDVHSVPTENGKNKIRPPLLALVIYAGIGAGSIMLEIGWIRLYGMIFLRTEYVLGVILAVFLLGIALGSLFLSLMYKYWLSLLMPFVVCGGVLLGLLLLPATSAWVEQSQFHSFFGVMFSQALVLGLLTLPVTLALGAWLPFLSNRYGDTQTSGVWFYGANCLGGGLGAIFACLVCMPLLGSVAMVAISGLAIAALGLIWVKSRWAWMVFTVLLLVGLPLTKLPPVHDLLPKLEANSHDLYLYEDAVSLTHVVEQEDGQRILLSDLQRMDASTEPSAVEIQMDQARLPLLLHPSPHSVLFLGLGTGTSMAGSMPFPALDRSAVELSQGSIFAAMNWFSPINGNSLNQARIIRDDARHFISSTQQNYDVIIGDLFHPDIAGMGSLLSVQQFQRVRNHLNSDGLFVQWLALNQFDIESLKVVMRSFQRIFPNAQMFMDGMHLALVGSRNKSPEVNAMLANLSRLTELEKSKATGGEGAWTWLGRYWGQIPKNEGPVQDEWLPFIEFKLPRARYDGSVNLASLMSWLLLQHPVPEEAMKLLGVDSKDKEKFGRAYVATEFAVRGWISSIQGDAVRANRLIWLAYQTNSEDNWIANALADSMLQNISQAGQNGLSEREALLRILKIYPKSVGALRGLLHLERVAGDTQEAEHYRLRLFAISPLDREAGVAL